ncbi:hypothetical protein CTA2_5243 [Colletotrichum tanaceti]|uniref:Uncharacterized protein n=1 Tax=Colletotrichum tanaceti TaxID=1306861 RepID=A0A4V6DH95_9PEZI|nr:hypothetical protein CTA2_5243 [Colletotrichum tanaceti]TKW55716.1 hypothetical protein CTA1_9857 [Colletotrichum tanaceti]
MPLGVDPSTTPRDGTSHDPFQQDSGRLSLRFMGEKVDSASEPIVINPTMENLEFGTKAVRGMPLGVDPGASRSGTIHEPFQHDSSRFRGQSVDAASEPIVINPKIGNLEFGTKAVRGMPLSVDPSITHGGSIHEPFQHDSSRFRGQSVDAANETIVAHTIGLKTGTEAGRGIALGVDPSTTPRDGTKDDPKDDPIGIQHDGSRPRGIVGSRAAAAYQGLDGTTPRYGATHGALQGDAGRFRGEKAESVNHTEVTTHKVKTGTKVILV